MTSCRWAGFPTTRTRSRSSTSWTAGTSAKRRGANEARFNRPRYNRAIARIGRLSGEARRRAWAELDANMMRDDPPWAPFVNVARRDFVSKSFGCYFLHPVYRLDIAATCKK